LNQRYYSLDVFRGATVALMILVNNPGTWAHIFDPLEHAPWHGLTPTDLVFPFFLFAVGNAMAFVMPRLQAAGDAIFWKKVVKRSLLIFAIGLFLNWWPFFRWQGGELEFISWTWTNSQGNLAGVRIMGVLQRIALAYFFASIIVYYLKPRGSFVAGMIMLLVYWLITFMGNPADPYSLSGWFGIEIDQSILGAHHMYKGEGIPFEPEGLMSTLPAIVQVILGYLVGAYIIGKGKEVEASMITPNSTTSDDQLRSVKTHALYYTLTGLFMGAMALLFAGYAWGLSFPINKKIWTSSYVILTTGMAIAILATMIYAIEVKKVRGWWTRFFDVFGKNALFVFALSAFLPKGLRLIRIPNGLNSKGEPAYLSPWNWPYEKVYKFIPGPKEIGSLAFALTVILFMWAICYWLDRRKIYIKV
jgi:predicted acyltransferase